jgi:hypothetical protein
LLANANMTVNGVFTAGTANIANFKITSGGNIDGNIFKATLFQGNGANITFINGSNVNGVVANASNASFATTSTTANLANGIALGAFSNITGVGTLTSLSVSGNFDTSTGHATIGGFMRMSVNSAVAAAGVIQGTATMLTKTINVVTSVVSGTGVTLPTATPGQVIYVINDVNATIYVYPFPGQYIDGMAQNAAFSIGPFGRMTFIATTGSKYYTMTSIYA